jgi:hypothetical protein
MGLPAAQQRALNAIETELRWRDPRLASLFVTFTRLTCGDGAPRSETLPGRVAWRRHRHSPRRTSRATSVGHVRALLLLPLAAVLVISAIFLGLSTSHLTCPARYGYRGPVASAAHTRPCPPMLQAKYPGQPSRAATIR